MQPQKPLITTTGAQDCVLAYLLDKWADTSPDKVFARFFGSETWSYADTRSQARRTAHALAEMGVKQGDYVLCWLPNGPDMLRIWFGLNLLGAVFVPFNTSYRGALLEHVLTLTGANLLIGHGQLLDRLKEVDHGQLTDVISVGSHPTEVIGDLTVRDGNILQSGPDEPVQTEHPIQPWDEQSVIFTSGTTGPSKAVLSSYAHLYAASAGAYDPFTSSDGFLVNLPMYHCAGTIPVYTALAKGGSIGVIESFHPDTYWAAVDEMHCTWAYMVLAMPRLLMRPAKAPKDKEHALKHVIISGDTREFCRQFGVQGHTGFNMSEICTATFTDYALDNDDLALSCGRLRPDLEARIVDANDNELPCGEVGELILRSERPYMFSHGYLNDPAATAKAWRNGWFHTGDLMRVDGAGNYFFIDRLKDAIRRRGENISSYEVETATNTFESVRETAAIPVRDTTGDEEVMVVVTLEADATFDNVGLIDHLTAALPHFMVPRFVRVVNDLPRTPTGKIQKVGLVAEGVTPDTWDRAKAGIVLKRTALS